MLEEEEREELILLVDIFLLEVDTTYLNRVTLDHKICSLLSPQFVGLVSNEDNVVEELESRLKLKSSDKEIMEPVVSKKVVDSFFNLIPTKKRKTVKKR